MLSATRRKPGRLHNGGWCACCQPVIFWTMAAVSDVGQAIQSRLFRATHDGQEDLQCMPCAPVPTQGNPLRPREPAPRSQRATVSTNMAILVTAVLAVTISSSWYLLG